MLCEIRWNYCIGGPSQEVGRQQGNLAEAASWLGAWQGLYDVVSGAANRRPERRLQHCAAIMEHLVILTGGLAEGVSEEAGPMLPFCTQTAVHLLADKVPRSSRCRWRSNDIAGNSKQP